ncbi:MAG TPA: tetratricopeptide repeat protein [Usitatibacteraceae bacterium]|nr:tetratricopeptide repeat protein [Usitatibacteraceae bacterium]
MTTRHALALALVLAATPAAAAPTETQVQTLSAARAEYLAARRAMDRQDWDGAIACLRNAERLDPGSADVQNLLGYAHRQKGDVDASFRYYERALQLNPYHLGAHEYIGRSYLASGKPEKAAEHMAKLEEYCMATCPERDSLRRAITEGTPWKPGARGGRAAY